MNISGLPYIYSGLWVILTFGICFFVPDKKHDCSLIVLQVEVAHTIHEETLLRLVRAFERVDEVS